jgi:DNA-directed RNA polymerase subunit RPC12/RpoP
MQVKVEAEVPLVNCPHCVKRWPMAIKSLSAPLRGKQSKVEFMCANCGTTLVQQLPPAVGALS